MDVLAAALEHWSTHLFARAGQTVSENLSARKCPEDLHKKLEGHSGENMSEESTIGVQGTTGPLRQNRYPTADSVSTKGSARHSGYPYTP